MVRAEFAGCGKNYACKALEARGHQVCVACPTNKIVQNSLENGMALNDFSGVGMTDVVNVCKSRRFGLRRNRV
jgi:hypothetical protein